MTLQQNSGAEGRKWLRIFTQAVSHSDLQTALGVLRGKSGRKFKAQKEKLGKVVDNECTVDAYIFADSDIDQPTPNSICRKILIEHLRRLYLHDRA